jgi:hypothetical protein
MASSAVDPPGRSLRPASKNLASATSLKTAEG